MPPEAVYDTVSSAFVRERSTASTLPFAVDDPSQVASKLRELSNLVVDLYNGGRSANMKKGSVSAKSIPLISLNHPLQQEER